MRGTIEIAKDVAVMANQVGGLVIIGIAEDERGHAVRLSSVPINDAEKDKILQAVVDRVHLMVNGFEVRMVPTQADPAVGYFVLECRILRRRRTRSAERSTASTSIRCAAASPRTSVSPRSSLDAATGSNWLAVRSTGSDSCTRTLRG